MNLEIDLGRYKKQTYFKGRISYNSEISQEDVVGYNEQAYIEASRSPAKGIVVGLAIMLPFYTTIIGLVIWLTHR